MIGSTGVNPNWIPHLHMLVRHRGIDRDELRAALARRFPGTRRVHVKAFYLDRNADENAEAIIEYVLKRSAPLILDGGREEPWPVGVGGSLLCLAAQPQARTAAAPGEAGSEEETRRGTVNSP